MKRKHILVEKYEVDLKIGVRFLDWQRTAPSMAHALRIAKLPASTKLVFNEHGWAKRETPGKDVFGNPVVMQTVFTIRD